MLRPYQRAAAQKAVEFLTAPAKRGERRRGGIITVPTGGGKGHIIAAIVNLLPLQCAHSPAPHSPAAIEYAYIITHSQLIATQNKARLLEAGCSGKAYCSTIQSLMAKGAAGDRRRNQLASLAALGKMCFIIDECHWAAGAANAASRGSDKYYARLLKLFPNTPFIGLSATPELPFSWTAAHTMAMMAAPDAGYSKPRGAGEGGAAPLRLHMCSHPATAPLWGKEIYRITLANLLEQGYLCGMDYRINPVLGELAHSSNVDAAGEVREGEQTLAVMEHIDELLNIIKSAEKPCLVFTAGIQSAEALAIHYGKEAICITSCNTAKVNKDALEQLKSGDKQVAVNVGQLTTGFDFPAARSIVLARNVRSSVLLAQILGRGMRPAAGKTLCRVYDLTGSLHGEKRSRKSVERGDDLNDILTPPLPQAINLPPIVPSAVCYHYRTPLQGSKGVLYSGNKLALYCSSLGAKSMPCCGAAAALIPERQDIHFASWLEKAYDALAPMYTGEGQADSWQGQGRNWAEDYEGLCDVAGYNRHNSSGCDSVAGGIDGGIDGGLIVETLEAYQQFLPRCRPRNGKEVISALIELCHFKRLAAIGQMGHCKSAPVISFIEAVDGLCQEFALCGGGRLLNALQAEFRGFYAGYDTLCAIPAELLIEAGPFIQYEGLTTPSGGCKGDAADSEGGGVLTLFSSGKDFPCRHCYACGAANPQNKLKCLVCREPLYPFTISRCEGEKKESFVVAGAAERLLLTMDSRRERLAQLEKERLERERTEAQQSALERMQRQAVRNNFSVEKRISKNGKRMIVVEYQSEPFSYRGYLMAHNTYAVLAAAQSLTGKKPKESEVETVLNWLCSKAEAVWLAQGSYQGRKTFNIGKMRCAHSGRKADVITHFAFLKERETYYESHCEHE